MLDESQRRRVAAAVAAAERGTSGEIVCVYERRLAPDRTTPLLVAGAAALAAPPLVLGAQIAWFPPWEAAQIGAGDGRGALLGEIVLLQLAFFLGVLALMWVPRVRRALTPRAIARTRVHEAALEHFLARGVHATRQRTGVLIFVVDEEHQVEIVADKGIYEKVGHEVWGDAAAALVAGLRSGDAAGGFEAAISKCGAVLAEHFPRRADDADELSDHVVVIDD